MSINGLSFASARPAPQPCVSVHRYGVFENLCILAEVVYFFIIVERSQSTSERFSRRLLICNLNKSVSRIKTSDKDLKLLTFVRNHQPVSLWHL